MASRHTTIVGKRDLLTDRVDLVDREVSSPLLSADLSDACELQHKTSRLPIRIVRKRLDVSETAEQRQTRRPRAAAGDQADDPVGIGREVRRKHDALAQARGAREPQRWWVSVRCCWSASSRHGSAASPLRKRRTTRFDTPQPLWWAGATSSTPMSSCPTSWLFARGASRRSRSRPATRSRCSGLRQQQRPSSR